MAAKIPQQVRYDVIDRLILRNYLGLLNQGKVRELLELPGYPELLLVVASDRLSVYDFVLNTLIPFKGEVLNAMNVFWRTHVLQGISHDLIAFGTGIDAFLPGELRGNQELQKRATVVKKCSVLGVEGVVRGYLTGTGLKAYDQTKVVCGHRLPNGLRDGSRLPRPLFTPTTKAEEGHDEHIDFRGVREKYGMGVEDLCLDVYSQGATYALSRGIIIADTKFETDGKTLLDEVLTPDSSRFWLIKAWEKAQSNGKSPGGFDKEFARKYAAEHFLLGDIPINKLDPKNPDHIAFVHSQILPDIIRAKTGQLYRTGFYQLYGEKLEYFQKYQMGIKIEPKRLKVEVVIGSENDYKQMSTGLAELAGECDYRVSIMSCHRNCDELPDFVKNDLAKADVVIAGAGKAAALPGMVKSLLCKCGAEHIPVIGVAFEGETDADDQAAISSIENLPGEVVEVDEEGDAYFGAHGFALACAAAKGREFAPKSVEPKPSKIGKWNVA